MGGGVVTCPRCKQAPVFMHVEKGRGGPLTPAPEASQPLVEGGGGQRAVTAFYPPPGWRNNGIAASESWEPGGSASDVGWGPWSVETGWTATWATAGLYSAAGGGSLWDMATGAGGAAAGVLDAQLLAQWCGAFFEGTDVACP